MSRLSPDKQAEHTIRFKAGPVTLEGQLCLPALARGLVVFVHGSGSSRHSPRNQFVAGVLNSAGLATFLFDLLTPDEERIDSITAMHRFDIELLAERVVWTVKWLSENHETASMNIGLFGASTGAAAALVAASRLPGKIKAVVSRGGRPDLAGTALQYVHAPTLLIAGQRDGEVIDLNERALHRLPRSLEKTLTIVPHATHLFEEPGTLERVADLAANWCKAHLE
ncbi:MAG TPA: dienelactone hydrolase family protein [Chroococcales cyanobacterium]